MPNQAARSRGNVVVTYNGNALTDYLNQADLNATVEQLDKTTFGSSGKESLADTPEWSISFSGLWDVTLDGYLAPDIISPGTARTASIAFTDANGDTVTYTWTSNAEIQNFGISASVGSLIGNSTALVLSGAPSRVVS